MFCCLSYTCAVQLIREVFHLDISFLCWFRVRRALLCVVWSLHSWRSLWSRRQGSRRYDNSRGTDSLGDLWTCPCELPVSLRKLFFLVKVKTPSLVTTLLKCRIISISELSDVGLREFCCIIFWFPRLPRRDSILINPVSSVLNGVSGLHQFPPIW